MEKSNFVIVQETDEYMYIVDISLHFDTITNTVKSVLSQLYAHHILGNKRLIYRDSDGRIDEIKHNNGVFINFAPGHSGIDTLPPFSASYPYEILSVNVQWIIRH